MANCRNFRRVFLVILSSIPFMTGQHGDGECNEAFSAFTCSCIGRNYNMTANLPTTHDHRCLKVYVVDLLADSEEQCTYSDESFLSAISEENECRYSFYFLPGSVPSNFSAITNQINSSCGGHFTARNTLYCLPPNLPYEAQSNIFKTPVDHFHLVVSDSKKGRASGKSFVEIVSYEVGSPDRDIQIYNLTALRCFLTISANYEVFLGGYYFDMDNTENQGESCLVISHGASAESKKHKLCEAKQEGSIKHVILPCENQERRAEITFTGPNTTRFNLPILGKDEKAFSVSCSFGSDDTDDISTTTVTDISTTTVTDITTSIQTDSTVTKDFSPANQQETTTFTAESGNALLIIIIACALGGLLLIVLLVIIIICCYNKRKKASRQAESNNHAIANLIYTDPQPEFTRYTTHIESRLGYTGQRAALGGNLSSEDRIYQVDVDMPADEKKFDIQQKTAVMTDVSGLYAVPNKSMKKNRRTNSSSGGTSERQSELGSLGWDNHGASNGVNPGFEGEGVEMVENDVYTRGNPY